MDNTILEYDIRNDDIHQELNTESSAPGEDDDDEIPIDFVDVENPAAIVEIPQQSFLHKINHDLHRFKHAMLTPAFTLLPKIDATRAKLEHMYIESNSPISSNPNSDCEDSDISERTAPF